ncbi:MAG: sulfotransferase family protein [Acidimicrobiales bacterium]
MAEPSPGCERPAGPRVPDFFVVGHAKSGTTALYEMLRQHPQIFMPDLKEPMFFATDLRPRFQAPHKGLLPVTLENYVSLFAAALPGQLLGEASAFYLFSRTAAASIAACNPAARVIAIFREPAAFLCSLHLQHRQDHQESRRSLRKALALEADREQGRRVPPRSYCPQLLRYSEQIRYTDQLSRYREVLPPGQILALVYDDYRGDNAGTLRRVLDFLGVDASVPLAATEANPTVAVRSQLLDETVHRVSVGRDPVSRVVKAGIKAAVPPSARRRLLGGVQSKVVHGEPRFVDRRLVAELQAWVRPEVERFSHYMDRDLIKLWHYDDAG